MKQCYLMLAAALAAMVLPGCLALSSKSKNYQPLIYKVPLTRGQIVSYSVSFANNICTLRGDGTHGRIEEGWFDEDDAKSAVRDVLRNSPSFRGAYIAEPGLETALHFHFNFEQSSATRPEHEFFIGTFFIIPTVISMDAFASVTVSVYGQEVDSYQTHWETSTCYWLPFILTAPFANRSGLAEDLVEDLLEQMEPQLR